MIIGPLTLTVKRVVNRTDGTIEVFAEDDDGANKLQIVEDARAETKVGQTLSVRVR